MVGEIGNGASEHTHHDGSSVMCRAVESLYCTPCTDATLHVNYTGIRIKNLIEKEELAGGRLLNPSNRSTKVW